MRRTSYRFGIATATDDLHALIVARRLGELGHECHVLELDAVAGSGALSWTLKDSALPTRDGGLVDPHELDVVWWRRAGSPQRLPETLANQAHRELVDNDCRAAYAGALLTRFEGGWVNDPGRAQRAENKLVQLRAARAAGFSVPETLVSQDPGRIRAFCEGRARIVKPVLGTARAGVLTRTVSPDDLVDEHSLRIAPAIYQALVPGTRHLRVQCFGDRTVAVLVTATELDWRPHLDSPMELWPVPDQLAARLRSVLDLLGLRMGIVDLKVTDDDEVVWLEVNQQGQFLFLEGLVGAPLTEVFCAFLVDEAAARTG